MKYINKNKLEEFLNELTENLGNSDFDRGYLCAIDTILGCYLNTIKTKELSSLPSNLGEAAKEYARCYTESDNGNGGDDWEDDISIAFMAGVRWLAEKGVTLHVDSDTEWADVDAFVHKNVDNKTVIQIRQ